MHPTHDYVGRKPCGCCVALVVDCADARTADLVSRLIRDGLSVNRVDWGDLDEIMAKPTFMACPHGQLALPFEGLDLPGDGAVGCPKCGSIENWDGGECRACLYGTPRA